MTETVIMLAFIGPLHRPWLVVRCPPGAPHGIVGYIPSKRTLREAVS